MEALAALLIPIAAAGLAVWFILWVKRRRRMAGKRDDETQPTGPDGF
jgi:hypothetical protein